MWVRVFKGDLCGGQVLVLCVCVCVFVRTLLHGLLQLDVSSGLLSGTPSWMTSTAVIVVVLLVLISLVLVAV